MPKPSLLIIGGSGYVGQALIKKASEKFSDISWTYFLNRVNGNVGRSLRLDIRYSEDVRELIQNVKPSIIYHIAYDRNHLNETIVIGTQNIIRACGEVKKTLFFLSTDSVFDGDIGWYREEDLPNPIFDYGLAKYEAEKSVLKYGGKVVRTSLIYGFNPLDPRTKVFIQGLKTRQFPYPYFMDEFRCPIFVDDLCEALLEMAFLEVPPILHIAGPERISRYNIVVKFTKALGLDERFIPKGSLDESGLVRPKDVSLLTSLAKNILKTKLRSLSEVLEENSSFKNQFIEEI